jgi:hypothetical protein
MWELTLDEAIELIEADPEYCSWLDVVESQGPAGPWACPHCGADTGWGCGLCCLRCGQVVVPF